MCLFQYRLVVSTVCTLLFQCLTISVSDTDNRVEDNSPLHFTGGVKVLVRILYVCCGGTDKSQNGTEPIGTCT